MYIPRKSTGVPAECMPLIYATLCHPVDTSKLTHHKNPIPCSILYVLMQDLFMLKSVADHAFHYNEKDSLLTYIRSIANTTLKALFTQCLVEVIIKNRNKENSSRPGCPNLHWVNTTLHVIVLVTSGPIVPG